MGRKRRGTLPFSCPSIVPRFTGPAYWAPIFPGRAAAPGRGWGCEVAGRVPRYELCYSCRPCARSELSAPSLAGQVTNTVVSPHGEALMANFDRRRIPEERGQLIPPPRWPPTAVGAGDAPEPSRQPEVPGSQRRPFGYHILNSLLARVRSLLPEPERSWDPLWKPRRHAG